MRKRYSKETREEILSKVRGGQRVSDVAKNHGISEPTYYKWKTQYSGMTVSHLSQLRELQDENARLKRMYADLSLDHSLLKKVIEKKL